MPTLAELKRKARTIVVHWRIDENNTVPIQVTYDPSKITLDSLEIKHAESKTLQEFYAEKLQNASVAWDLRADDGQMLPTTPEGIKDLEVTLVALILEKVNEDARGNQTPSTSST